MTARAANGADGRISAALAERVLAKLGLSALPTPDRAGLAALYAAWCRSVPFDNARKLIHLRAGDPAPLPGDAPSEFFAAWLQHGAGGTCWALHGALCALLEACGFDARRAIATMLVMPDLPPNHGTVTVRLDGETLLVDGTLQHGVPLALYGARESAVAHPAWGVTARPEGAKWLVRWRSPFTLTDMDCRLDSLAGDDAAFRTYHEATRTWSPFNFQLNVRVHRGGGVVGVTRGERIFIDAAGAVARAPIAGAERLRFMIEEAGFSEELAVRVPEDIPLQPPPGSATARAAAAIEPAAS
jgi:N-hydroxyarylamine O-acetyltransferase